jgi:predicted PurR-regulated permease PerM/CheY-like chemotaxis protein
MREPTDGWQQARATLRTLLVVVTTAAVVWLLFALRGIVLLIVLSVFFAYLVAPIVERLHAPIRIGRRRRRLPRAAAIGIVYLVFLGAAGTTLYELVPRIGEQVSALAKVAPAYVAAQRAQVQSLDSWYRRTRLPPSVRDAIESAGGRALTALARRGEELSGEAIASLRFLPWLLLIPVIGFFLLRDAESFRRSALRVLPPGRVRWRGADFLAEVNSTLAFFIRAQLLACLFVGSVCTIGFVALGVPYAWALGCAATLLELFPFFGPVTMFAVATIFASTRSLGLALAVFVFLALLRAVHDYAVYPRLIARGIKLHPLAIMMAILCGSTLGGFLGLVLAIPVTAIVSISYRFLRLHLGTDGLVSELVHHEAPPDVPAVVTADHDEVPEDVRATGKLSGIRVLVVENEEDARWALMNVLEGDGATVFAAGSAAEALLLLGKIKPHVMVSDLAMPGEDGFDLIRKVRALATDGGGTVPAIALSGYSTEEDRERALKAGFQRHLPKPVDPNQLARVVVSLKNRVA